MTKPLSPEERKAIRSIVEVVRERDAGRLSADEAIRRIGEIVAEEDARVAASREPVR